MVLTFLYQTAQPMALPAAAQAIRGTSVIKLKTIFLRISLIIAGVVALAFNYFELSPLGPNMRGPSGYYVLKGDPGVFVEFFKKPNARSNLVEEYGVAPFLFSAFDTDIHMSGPVTAPKEEQRSYWISGEGSEIVILDMSAPPYTHGRFPKMEFKRVEK